MALQLSRVLKIIWEIIPMYDFAALTLKKICLVRFFIDWETNDTDFLTVIVRATDSYFFPVLN